MRVQLVYVDEQDNQANEVAQAALTSGEFSQNEILTMRPQPELESTVELIEAHHCDVLITDYRLSEHMASVNFNGAELVAEYQRRYDRFPCFIATAFAGDAIEESIDTNIVFPKSDFLLTKNLNALSKPDLPFFMRVRRKVDEYRTYIDATIVEFNELAAKNETEEINAQEVERLIQLDGIVEVLRGRNYAVPTHLKGDPLASIGKLIDKADALVARVKKELGE